MGDDAVPWLLKGFERIAVGLVLGFDRDYRTKSNSRRRSGTGAKNGGGLVKVGKTKG